MLEPKRKGRHPKQNCHRRECGGTGSRVAPGKENHENYNSRKRKNLSRNPVQP